MSSCGSTCLATIYLKNTYIRSSAVEDSLYRINVFHFVNLSTTTKIESNSVLVIGSLDSNSFIIKSNNTELHTLSEICNNYKSVYRRCLLFLIY